MTSTIRTAALALLLTTAFLATPAVAQVNDDVQVRRIPGGVRLTWAARDPGWTWNVLRSSSPASLPAGVPIATAIPGLSYDDLSVPGGLVVYGIHGEPPPAGCVDDAFEDNDISVAAVPAPSGWQSLRRCAGDDDWFSVSVLAGQPIRAGITYDDALVMLRLELARPDGTILASDPFSLLVTPPSAGTYLVRVTGDAAAEGDYRMLIESPFAAAACDPDYAAPNQSIAEAIPGWPERDVFTWMTMCDGLEDWWTETVPAGYTLDAWVDPFFPIAYDLSDPSWYIVELYDTDGVTLLLQLDSRDGALGFSWDSLAGGTYFVRVRAHITTSDYWDHMYEIGCIAYPT